MAVTRRALRWQQHAAALLFLLISHALLLVSHSSFTFQAFQSYFHSSSTAPKAPESFLFDDFTKENVHGQTAYHRLCTLLGEMISFSSFYTLFLALHEAFHLLAAALVGLAHRSLRISNFVDALLHQRVTIKGAEGWRSTLIRHAGWIGSMAVTLVVCARGFSGSCKIAAFFTLIDSLCSDLLGIHHGSASDEVFHCGNFGIIIFDKEKRGQVYSFLKTMVRITMMRGAQSGGIVTYVPKKDGLKGIRSRVVNGKRTDLSELVTSKLWHDQLWASLRYGLRDDVRVYAGHTRFATSSKASLDGTHPHQWTPAADYTFWEDKTSWMKTTKNVEVYICHNGDFDALELGGSTYPLEDIMECYHPCPSTVDSAGVAGVMDVMRTQGLWFHSLRFGFLFGPERTSLKYEVPPKEAFVSLARIADDVFQKTVQTAKMDRRILRQEVKSNLVEAFGQILGLNAESGDVNRLVNTAVDAFFDQDLFQATRFFLSRAKGSFGLCVSCSLDSHRQIVLAARGQTISLAFYPNSGVVLWGSEQAAVKAALVGDSKHFVAIHECSRCGYAGAGHEDDGAVRLDLDDLGGEVCLVDWGTGKATRSAMTEELPVHQLMDNKLTITLSQETLGKLGNFKKRLVRLHDNPLIKPLPPVYPDPVGKDIADIPYVLNKIQQDWDEGNSVNCITSWWFSRELIKRLKRYEAGTHDGSIDVLLTGCEVSLWVAEQFASDLAQVFPRISVRVISSNKLLGLFGQEFAVPQTGHQFNEESWKLTNTIVLIVSHSGGTFGSLAVANLLRAYTEVIFVVASESDTQIGKQLRQLNPAGMWDFKCSTFSTEVGIRPAEPCTVSVVASHQLLTQLLIYLMKKVQLDGMEEASGGKYTVEDVKVLEELHAENFTAMEDIVGYDRNGIACPTYTSEELKKRGRYWSLHVLEVPMSWMLSFCYILGTLGRPLKHRMTSRSLVIADIPWVAQSVEAYVSKLFACAYSATSLNVYSANPSDHLVHRMTHRVVRGCLLACGRPDGRLIALTSAEASACLSVNQASSIQSIGSTCESLTIGHNPYKLSLSAHAVFLKSFRKQASRCRCPPLSLSLSVLRLLEQQQYLISQLHLQFICEHALQREFGKDFLNKSSSGVILGAYSNIKKRNMRRRKKSVIDDTETTKMDGTVTSYVSFNQGGNDCSISIRSPEETGHGLMDVSEHTHELVELMNEGKLHRKKSKKEMKSLLGELHNKSMRVQMEENYYGELLEKEMEGTPLMELVNSQTVAMRLYESRIASMQRCVAFYVMFHALGKRVQDFWPSVSLGYLRYDMSRTHSIMRIATTASPVSGAEVRDITIELEQKRRIAHSRTLLSRYLEKRKLRLQREKERARMEEETRKKLLSRFDPEQISMLGKLMGTQLNTADPSMVVLQAIVDGKKPGDLKDAAPEEVASSLQEPASPDIQPVEVEEEDERRAAAELPLAESSEV
ncbi:hypothetical protein GUITHDRAFT_99235 [Guillardia theta CCMP2712]|uniref:Glutamine amidotransferase type-2 domain-containing protein n=1 Tax=Guillardia theta (strain CCMP2712) TaxID=905079 RepID=L1K522_GUITC|nr:hypothetical protein GUITHDRAFT_99235 [Guillardia theta CCMP2712]EKX55458.1 hypothetical protein GUITHDRAFT_99235 [Guillardia theta CCMP2712]|eukprot:XP_005842438.1 hypothetical protein GUITHDRAFT_99235 [Guillardia theta CCMP2712]